MSRDHFQLRMHQKVQKPSVDLAVPGLDEGAHSDPHTPAACSWIWEGEPGIAKRNEGKGGKSMEEGEGREEQGWKGKGRGRGQRTRFHAGISFFSSFSSL